MPKNIGLFSKLPTETFERILFEIDSPKDLLNFALTNKGISKCIIPNHIEYRTIRCDPYRQELWDALIAKPSLTKGIRRLCLTSEMGPHEAPKSITPKSLGFDSNDMVDALEWEYEPWVDAMKAFLKAAKMMPNLIGFSWMIPEPRQGTRLEPLFKFIVQHCAEFKELEIDFKRTMESLQLSEGVFGKSICKLSNLTVFRMSVPSTGNASYGKGIQEMLLNRCLQLQNLTIIIGGIDDYFQENESEDGDEDDEDDEDEDDDEVSDKENDDSDEDEDEEEENEGSNEKFLLRRLFIEGKWPLLKTLHIEGDFTLYVDDKNVKEKELTKTFKAFFKRNSSLVEVRLCLYEKKFKLALDKDCFPASLKVLCVGEKANVEISRELKAKLKTFDGKMEPTEMTEEDNFCY